MTTPLNYTREQFDPQTISDWIFNPRQGDYRDMKVFTAQIVEDGGILEDMHLCLFNGVLTALQGHRRKHAAIALEIPLVWAKFYGELSQPEAFKLLMTLQNGSDPFAPRELAFAAHAAVHEMGMTASEVAKIFHRAEDRVQLYLALDTLPVRVKEAVYDKRLSLEIAEMFLELPTVTMQEKALGEVLCSGLHKAPMSAKQAQVHLDENYLKPVKREAEWEKLKKKLLAKYPLDEGYSYVSYAQRDDFVMTETRELPEFARVDSWVPSDLLNDPAEPLKWEFLRSLYGVPVFVCPALGLPEKYLLLVAMKAVKDSDAMAETPLLRGRASKAKKVKGGGGGGASDPRNTMNREQPTSEPEAGEQSAVAEPEAPLEPAPFPMARIDRVWAVLIENPTKVMGDSLWKELIPVVCSEGNRQLPPAVFEALMQKTEQDTAKTRRGMRVCFVWMVALGLLPGRPFEAFGCLLEDIEDALNLPPVE